MKKTGLIFSMFAALALLLTPAAALADDISDQLKQALKFYEDGKIAQALTELDFAAAQLREKKGEAMQAILPEAPAGWKANKAETESAGTGMLGGGIQVSRKYQQDGGQGRIAMKIVTDSPLLQSLSMMMSNPMFMQGGRNGKLIRLAGYKGILKSNSDDRATLQVIVASKALVEVEVSHAAGADELAKEMFKKSNLDKLQEMIQ